MPLITLFANAAARGFGIIGGIKNFFIDTFVRGNTSGSLGTASDGSIWNAIRGVFTVNSNLAQGDSTNYPIATLQDIPYTNANVLVKSPSNGAGISFWVTDSGNWWAVATEQTTTSCNCSNYSYCNGYGCTGYGCNSYGCASSFCSGYTCVSYGCTNAGCTASGCTSYGCTYRVGGGYCVAYGCTATGCTSYGCISSGCTVNACTSYSCSSYGCTGYGCTSSGCTSYATGTTCDTCYPRSIRILQSAAGTVSAIYSVASSALANALRLKTSGNQIEVTAYSDTSATSQIDSPITYTATGSTQTKKYGLVVSPATYGQGTTVGEITVNPN